MDVTRYRDRFAVGLGWLVCLALLVAGVPCFLRMPPWCDLTLYEMAARTVMRGGTHYRDVFDTNLPGFVWCVIGIRRLFGESFEAVRAVDLAVVFGIAFFLVKLVRRCGGTPVGIAWMAAALAAFYPFTCEFCHCQRDIWMTLPILAAVSLRLKHLYHPTSPERQRRGERRGAFIEGLLWGIAVWIKPHVLIIAFAIWYATRWKCQSRRDDLRGNLAGGSLIGLLGVLWLVATGTMGPFFEVCTRWNSRYVLTIWGDTPALLLGFFTLFPPWSLLHLIGIPLAIRDVRRRHGDGNALARGMLATLYLVFLFQSCVTQRYFDYIHVPEVFLLFAVLTVHRTGLLAVALLYVLSGPLLEQCLPRLKPVIVEHPVWNSKRLEQWRSCFESLDAVPYRQRQHALALNHEFFATINPVEIGEVADFLRMQSVTDGDVIAWHDSPHAVYLDLGIGTNFRFMHVTTSLMSDDHFWKLSRELRKTALPRARFIVTDLMHPFRSLVDELAPHRLESDATMLPPIFTPQTRAAFPYCQPVVFRSGNGRGRYLVHKLDPDITERLNDRTVKFEFEVKIWE